jgi:tRNA(adenine34) deaminase
VNTPPKIPPDLPPNVPPPAINSPIYLRHRQWMLRALSLAQAAGEAGEVPVAAIVVGPNNQMIAEATNRKEQERDPTAHAEVLALRAAGKQLGSWHLNDCSLYVTLEPCMMCAGAIIQSRLGLLVYGADDLKAGAIRSVLNLPDSPASNHRLSVLGGILEAPCREQLQQWFQRRR